MKHFSKYAGKLLATKGHGHSFCSEMHFPQSHSIFSSQQVSSDDYYGEDEEEDSLDVSNAGGDRQKPFNV